MPKTVYYASVGPTLSLYDLDVEAAALTKRAAVTLPANIQYAWPHPSRRSLYVVSSNGGPGIAGDKHFASALTIDPATGNLRLHGEPAALPSRPIHTSVDASGAYLLTAYNNPSNVTVHRLNADGTIGAPVAQPGNLDTGIYAHQVLAAPGNRAVMLVTRGNNAAPGQAGRSRRDQDIRLQQRRAEQSRVDRAKNERGNGLGFGPRHLDFHPTKPWVFVSIERQNKLYVYRLDAETRPRARTDVRQGHAVGSRIARAARRRTDPRSPERQVRLCDQSHVPGIGARRERNCLGRREQRRGVCHRSNDRRAEPASRTSTGAASSCAHSASTRRAASWLSPASWLRRTENFPPASRSCGSPPTANLHSCANTTSMSAAAQQFWSGILALG